MESSKKMKWSTLAFMTLSFVWCFFVTAASCILGMYVEGDVFNTVLNVITPIVLVALGLIFPIIAKSQKNK